MVLLRCLFVGLTNSVVCIVVVVHIGVYIIIVCSVGLVVLI